MTAAERNAEIEEATVEFCAMRHPQLALVLQVSYNSRYPFLFAATRSKAGVKLYTSLGWDHPLFRRALKRAADAALEIYHERTTAVRVQALTPEEAAG